MDDFEDLIPNKDPAMGNLDYEREELDFYETPEWVTDVLLRNINVYCDCIWEPACGKGAISNKLNEKYPNKVVSTDIVNRGYSVQMNTHDFLNDVNPIGSFRVAIITNPPYGKLTDEFIQKALNITETNQGMVAMLMRNEFDCAASRKKFFVNHPAFDKKIVLLKRPRWYEYKKGDAGPRHNYAWYVWDWNRNLGQPPSITYDK